MPKADAHKGSKLFICATPQDGALNQSAFAALTWVQVKKVGQVNGISTTPNVISYQPLDEDVTQKSKGSVNGGDWEVELAYIYNDAGQDALRAAAATDFEYAFKFEYSDSPDGVLSNTIIYNKGVVAGPRRPGGRVDDFILEQYTLGMNQKNIVVEPA